ncbi:armadillo-type protein [Powellomyces hirtus]|nr:armadillo-type protein [Powellomyces hirtus]
MDVTTLYQLFSATVRPEEAIRIPAEQELKKVEVSVGFLPAVLQILGSPEADEAVRQAAAVYFKNRCQRGWDVAKGNPLDEQDKEFVRQHILQAIVALPQRLRVQLIACLGSMLSADHLEGRWPQYLPEVMQLVQSSDEQSVHAGVAALYEFVKTYQWGQQEKRKAVNVVIEQGLPILHAVATRLVASDSQEAGFLVKSILKTYNSTIRLSLSETQQSSASLVPWGTLFVTIVEKPLHAGIPGMPEDPSEREAHPWWKAKKWAYSCLNVLFERYGRKPEKKYQAFSVMFMEHFAPNILNAYLKQIELLVSGTWMSSRVKQLIANFLENCVKPKVTWNIIKPHLEAIIMHFIFPQLCFSQEDQEQWEDDPLEYVHKKIDNPLEDFRSPVHAAETLVFSIAKLRSKQTFQPIMNLVNSVITKYNETPAEHRDPRQKDGALKLMSTLAPLATDQNSPVVGHIEMFLVNNVLPELKSSYGFLRARACETLLSYEEARFENDEHRQYAFQGVLACLRDSDLPVRVSGAMALRPFLTIKSIHEAMKPHVQEVIEALMMLTNEVDMESLTQVLESLVADFSEELSPFAVQLATQLCETFLRIMNEVFAEGEDIDMSEQLDEKTAAAQGVMRTVCTLVLAMEASPQILAQLEVIVAPAIIFVLERNTVDLYEEVFEVIETTTFCSKTISPVMWQMWPYVYKAFKTDAYDYIDEMTNSLENFISYGKDTFAQSTEHQTQMFDIIQTILRDNENDLITNVNRSRACDLIEAMLLHLRGRVDPLVPEFIDLAIPYLGKAKKAAFRVRCLEVIINAIYYNPAGTLTLLEQRGATTAFLTLWFKNLAEFRRVHDKKLCIVALSAVLELPAEMLPPSLQGAVWGQLLQGVLTVFETYPAALQAREEEEKMYTEELDEDEDVEDDEDVEQLFKDSTDDTDVLDNDDEYLEMLAKKASDSNPEGGAATTYDGTYEGDDDDDDDDDMWDVEDLEEDIFFESPLDSIDAYTLFETTMQKLAARPDTASLLQQTLTGQQQAFIQDIWRQGAEHRAKLAASAAAAKE